MATWECTRSCQERSTSHCRARRRSGEVLWVRSWATSEVPTVRQATCQSMAPPLAKFDLSPEEHQRWAEAFHGGWSSSEGRRRLSSRGETQTTNTSPSRHQISLGTSRLLPKLRARRIPSQGRLIAARRLFPGAGLPYITRVAL